MIKALSAGRILLPDREIENQVLLFEEKILGIVPVQEIPDEAEIIDADGLYISPGFVDVHIHGYLGADASDGDMEGLHTISHGLPENGVTSFLPTTMTIPWSDLKKALDCIRSVMPETKSPGYTGAEILGCHAEGPFINPKKKGAQSEDAIIPPDPQIILPYVDLIRLITVAPEMPGALPLIKTLSAKMAVSIGHTDADYDTVLQALLTGANHFTHLFNAMTGLNHRSPGVVGAALTENCWSELIADTFHVHPALFPLLHQSIGDHLVLITDCTRAGGLGDGEYELGGQPIFVKNISCRLKDGTIAGSVLKMNHAVRNYRDHAHVPLYEAVACASAHPAASIGLMDRKGSLLPGRDADLLLMDENCQVSAVWKSGRRIL